MFFLRSLFRMLPALPAKLPRPFHASGALPCTRQRSESPPRVGRMAEAVAVPCPSVSASVTMRPPSWFHLSLEIRGLPAEGSTGRARIFKGPAASRKALRRRGSGGKVCALRTCLLDRVGITEHFPVRKPKCHPANSYDVLPLFFFFFLLQPRPFSKRHFSHNGVAKNKNANANVSTLFAQV